MTWSTRWRRPRRGSRAAGPCARGKVDLGTELVGLGVDGGTDGVELVGHDAGAALVGVNGGVPSVVHGVGRHGAALGAGARGEHDARNDAGGSADDASKDEANRLLVHWYLLSMRTCLARATRLLSNEMGARNVVVHVPGARGGGLGFRLGLGLNLGLGLRFRLNLGFGDGRLLELGFRFRFRLGLRLRPGFRVQLNLSSGAGASSASARAPLQRHRPR